LMVFAPAGLFPACSAKGGASSGGMAYSIDRAAGAYATAAASAPAMPADSTAGTARVPYQKRGSPLY
jgi:hypothetical protein